MIFNREGGEYMDKFVSVFASQNPTMDIPCGNPECKRVKKIKTKEYFSAPNGVYEFVCDSCGKTTAHENIDKELDKLKKQFKSMGISW